MQLLISVTSEDEVAAAVTGGVDIVDVKNPREGSLGASFPHVMRRVRAATPAEIPVSVAIGDVPNLPGMTSLAAAGAAACGVQYIKVGLRGPSTPAEAVALLTATCRAAREIDPDVRIIATAYADADVIGSLPPRDLPAVAARSGADGCMIDTADKHGGHLFATMSMAELEGFVAGCRSAGLLCALAGSLSEADIPRLDDLGPDIVGFRSAVCRGDRVDGRVDAEAVQRLKRRISLP